MPAVWTSPRTFITGELETADIFNTHLRNNMLYLYGVDTPVLTTIVVGASPYAAVCGTVLFCDTTGGAITVNLPAGVANTNGQIVIKNIGASDVVLDGNAAETIEGETTQTLLTNDAAWLVCSGTAWYLI